MPIQAYSQESAIVRTLPNGLTLAMEFIPHVHSISAGVWIKTGSGNERPEQGGISHFIEHLLFKGTRNRSPRELVESIESKGGQINAFTTRDTTCLYVKVLENQWQVAVDVLADVVRNSLLCDVEKERNVILEEIASIEDVPEELAHDLFTERLWPGHPLGRPITGTAESVGRIRQEDLAAYYNTWYRPENIIFSMAGNFDPELVHQRLAQDFEDAEFQGANEGSTQPPRFTSGLEAAERDIGQSHVCFGFPGATSTSSRRYTYDLLASALGGGSTSRLFEKIREDEGLAYAIYSFESAYLLSGMFGVYAAVAPENLKTVLALCAREMRDIRDNAMPEEELTLNREQLKGGMLMSMESTFNRMARLAKSLQYHGRIVPLQEVLDNLEAITVNDVQTLAQEIFQPDQCCMVVVGPHQQDSLQPLPLD
ncbi:MAG: M16 family metallopeptidase [Candidatus Hydrogenedentota bacterium]